MKAKIVYLGISERGKCHVNIDDPSAFCGRGNNRSAHFQRGDKDVNGYPIPSEVMEAYLSDLVGFKKEAKEAYAEIARLNKESQECAADFRAKYPTFESWLKAEGCLLADGKPCQDSGESWLDCYNKSCRAWRYTADKAMSFAIHA